MRRPETDTGDQSLQDLMTGIGQSNPEALDALFERTARQLHQYVHRLAPPGESYDVIQDVFMKLWETRGTIDVHTGVKPLLYRMARNRALNARRKLRRVDLPDVLPERSAQPSAENGDALREQIQTWIAALPPRRSEAFILSRYHDLSHEQIARIMDLSIRTVQTHIVHALRDLRAELAVWQSADEG